MLYTVLEYINVIWFKFMINILLFLNIYFWQIIYLPVFQKFVMLILTFLVISAKFSKLCQKTQGRYKDVSIIVHLHF